MVLSILALILAVITFITTVVKCTHGNLPPVFLILLSVAVSLIAVISAAY